MPVAYHEDLACSTQSSHTAIPIPNQEVCVADEGNFIVSQVMAHPLEPNHTVYSVIMLNTKNLMLRRIN